MTDSIRDIMVREIKNRGGKYADTYADFYIASVGCHLVNIQNKANARFVLTEAGKLYDTRLHLLLVGPPGWSKSFWLSQFLDDHLGLALNVQSSFKAAMTEAGLVGTVSSSDGEIVEVPGIAKREKHSIIGIEEFSALTNMMVSTHSKGLDNALLTALDSGRVRKSLASGDIAYETYFTLWAGVQPARFDLTSGLGRRLCFLEFIPTEYDKEVLKQARRKSINRKYNPKTMKHLSAKMRELNEKLKGLQKIEFGSSLYEKFDEMDLLHFEEVLFEKIALGYYVMSRDIGKRVTVELEDKQMEKLLESEYNWRKSVARGSQISEVELILRENDGKMDVTALKDELMKFGLDWNQSVQLINDMRKHGVVTGKRTISLVRK